MNDLIVKRMWSHGLRLTTVTLPLTSQTLQWLALSDAITCLGGKYGLVPSLVEMLVDEGHSICERALLVINTICFCTEGRTAASTHALTLSVTVQKMLGVFDSATELANKG
ncbi:hypothetical protein SUGI_0077040 [Cryptomeria japonica]|nr:hypothetical protein SUGI_0077040 [Cryptomeria japonica]